MLSEKEYRALDIDSYSSIKTFLDDRKKYYRKFILKEVVKEEDTPETRFGSLVDCLLFTPDEYEERYALSLSTIPTGQYGKLVSELWKITLNSINDAGEVTRTLDSMLEDAYNAVKFNKDGEVVDFKRDSFEAAKGKFLGSDLEAHYKQLRESYGKSIIELSELENAQKVVQELKSNPVTREVINLKTDKRFEVYCQFPIIGEVDFSKTPFKGGKGEKFPLKCLLDKLIIDHEKKMIYIYDLKTAWDNEQQFQYNYFKYKYYIQMAVYFYLVVEWKKQREDIADYAVNHVRFIVAESSNYKNPLIYITSAENFHQGMGGFIINSRYHPGVVRAIQDLIWHKEKGIWNISKENYEANGVVKIKPFDKED